MAHPRFVPQQCAAPGCPYVGRVRLGLCGMHYQRLKSTGELGPPESLRQRGRECSIEGCHEPHKAHGYCPKHLQRWENTGDAGGLEPRQGGDDIAYPSAHSRALAKWGPASEYSCDDCDLDAYDWSYVHGCPQERVNSKGNPYCPHPEHYVPRCRSCHHWFDKRYRDRR